MSTLNVYMSWARGCTLDRKPLSPEAVLEIPVQLATCPKCEGKLYANFDAWEKQDDGTWAAECAKLTCENEPDVGSRGFADWMRWHYDMPYVDWLPLEVMITAWINRRYQFEID